MAPKEPSSPRFPRRTLVLMVLALAAFIWMYFASHRSERVPAAAGSGNVVDVTVNPSPQDAGR